MDVRFVSQEYSRGACLKETILNVFGGSGGLGYGFGDRKRGCHCDDTHLLSSFTMLGGGYHGSTHRAGCLQGPRTQGQNAVERRRLSVQISLWTEMIHLH